MTVITMRYGSADNWKYGAKQRENYTVSVSKAHFDGEQVFHGQLGTSDEESDLGFLFHHQDNPNIADSDETESALTAFLLDLVEVTNTTDQKWFVNPRSRHLTEWFDDYLYYIHPSSRPRDVSLQLSDTDTEIDCPSKLSDTYMPLLLRVSCATPGDVILESEHNPGEFEDEWFENISFGVDIRKRNGGGTEVVLDPDN